MAEPIVSFVLETIGTLLNEERKFLCGVSEQAEQLHSELQMMRALLRDADEKQNDSATVKEWVSQSKELAYEAENVLETHTFKLASRRRGEGARKVIRRYACILNECYIHHKFGLEIQSLNTRISNLTRRFQEYGIRAVTENEGSSSSNKLQQLRMTYPYASDDDDFVGFEEDIEKLVRALVNDSSGRYYGVVSICGMGGSGKTTLARKVFNHPNVKRHFDSFAWVRISQNWQTRDILQGILLQMKKGEIEKWRDEEIVEQLIRIQQERKCLVVLDDIWSYDAWDCIKVAFRIRSKGTKILLTTPNKAVAFHTCPNCLHFESRLLGDYESWKLFQKKAFGNRDAMLTWKEEEIARKIVRRSAGLPLAIVVVAGILKSKPVGEWESLLRYGHAGIRAPQSYGEIQRILSLSYDSLPYFLKPCFLYMGNFPDGSKIEVDTLCQLWIAEGLISETNSLSGETLMEVAVRYFHELAARNLVQLPEEEMSNWQGFSYGSLHDLMRDMCLTKAKEDDFFEIVMPESANWATDSVIRRAIYLDKHGDMDIRPYLGSKLRTLLFFNSFQQPGEELVSPQAIPDLRNLKWMRILHFEGVDFKGGKPPAGIGNLVLLRHLSFRDCYIEELPSSIGDLIFLLTLDLRVRERCRVAIPNVLFKLERLKHLYLPLKFHTEDDDKLQFDGMKELEILENFDTSMCNAGEISNLTKLRKLAVCAEGNIEDLEMIFKCIEGNADHLKRTTLDIRHFDIYSEKRLSSAQKLFKCRVLHVLRLEGRIGKIAESHAISESFTEIHLSGSQLEDDPMKTLRILPNLLILALETEAYIGKEMHCQDGFAELRSLKLSKLYKLESLQVENGAMPKLSTLSIKNCRRMEKLPEGLEYMNSLRKLKINMMPNEFVARLQKLDGKGGEELGKINTKFIIEFGNEPQLTNSTTEQNNSFQGRNFEFQMSTSTETPYFARRSACPPQNEWERDV